MAQERDPIAFAEGFIKHDGCTEIQMDHHMCGHRMINQFCEGLQRLTAYAISQGFEMD